MDTSLSKAKKRKLRKQQREESKTLRRPPLEAKTVSQKTYLEALKTRSQIFSVGCAGTGKTYLASRYGLSRVLSGEYAKIVICRPTMADQRHRVGFLPGDLNSKLKPWLIPILRSFKEEATGQEIDRLKSENKIEFVSFEHMRGQTFDNAFVILDEAQNCTYSDLRLFLTRIGKDTKVVVNGDLDQFDIRDSGLEEIVNMISKYKINAAVIRFDENDVVRSEIASEWVKAFTHKKKDL
jgi:phosphate starvation-inducible protein PhoH and related proteins